MSSARKLPNRCPTRTWGGPGIGDVCTICGVPVLHDDVELELEFDREADDPHPERYHVHVRCFAAWEDERRSPNVADATPSEREQMRPPSPSINGRSAHSSAGAADRGRALSATLDDGNIAVRGRDSFAYRREPT